MLALLACPTCGAAQTDAALWSVIGAFLALPFLVAGVGYLSLRKHLR